jgi:hypothetical protein
MEELRKVGDPTLYGFAKPFAGLQHEWEVIFSGLRSILHGVRQTLREMS